MDRTQIPTQEQVDAAKAAWQAATTEPTRRRAESIYRQLLARRLRETLG